jgi:lysozyme
MPRKANQNSINLITSFEGCKLTAYQDSVGIWTIGYGNTMYPNGISVKKGDVITKEQALKLFETILSRFETGVDKLVRTDITENQFGALVSFSYNLGIGTLQRSDLLRKVIKNSKDVTIRNEFMRFTKAGGKELRGLVRRRTAEADLYFKQ